MHIKVSAVALAQSASPFLLVYDPRYQQLLNKLKSLRSDSYKNSVKAYSMSQVKREHSFSSSRCFVSVSSFSFNSRLENVEHGLLLLLHGLQIYHCVRSNAVLLFLA